MQTTVVVMGRNYISRLGMIRAAGMAGCDVIAVRTMNSANRGEFDKKSKYVNKYYRIGEDDYNGILSILDDIKKAVSGPIVLIPTDDNMATFIDLRQEQLKSKFLYPNINQESGAVYHFMDKDIQKRLAKQADLPVAEGWSLTFVDNEYKIPKDVIYPCFVKPETSVNGAKSIMKKCDSKDELRQHLDYISGMQSGNEDKWILLVEQYIKIDKEYDLPGFANGDNVVIPAFIEKGLIHLGVTGTGKLIPSTTFQKTLEKLQSFIGGLNFQGLIDIELFESDGIIYFNELNMRFGASGYGVTGAGINLPSMFIYSLINKPIPRINVDFNGISFASEKVCFQEYASDAISWKSFWNIVNRADFCFIRSTDDPAPFNSFRLYTNKIRFKRFLLILLRKIRRR